MQPVQSGGAKLVEEGRTMISFFLLLTYTLIIVYMSRISNVWLHRMRRPTWQFASVIVLFGIADVFGWVHGILAALALSLVISRAYTQTAKETYQDYIVPLETPMGCEAKADNRWLSEKILGENPFVIREIPVRTSAVQDLSERNMGSSPSSK